LQKSGVWGETCSNLYKNTTKKNQPKFNFDWFLFVNDLEQRCLGYQVTFSEGISARSAITNIRILFGAAVQIIISVAANEDVAIVAAIQFVVTVSANDAILSIFSIDQVIASRSKDQLIGVRTNAVSSTADHDGGDHAAYAAAFGGDKIAYCNGQ
jgi:hypothetical protein